MILFLLLSRTCPLCRLHPPKANLAVCAAALNRPKPSCHKNTEQITELSISYQNSILCKNTQVAIKCTEVLCLPFYPTKKIKSIQCHVWYLCHKAEWAEKVVSINFIWLWICTVLTRFRRKLVFYEVLQKYVHLSHYWQNNLVIHHCHAKFHTLKLSPT